MIFPVTETKPSISSTIPIGTNGSSSKFLTLLGCFSTEARF